jgi:ABC-2 type transport system ATP-binding protein
MKKILEIKDLKKYYKENKAIDGLSFDLYEGEILGLLVSNGAGKSTTINILSAILKHDSGEVKFFGEEINRNRKK